MTNDKTSEMPKSPSYKIITKGELKTTDIFLRIKKCFPQSFILDSAENDKNGKWTFIGFNPKLEIILKNNLMTISKAENEIVRKFETQTPQEEIRKILKEYEHLKIKGGNMPPFTGGLVGYFAFEYMNYIEPTIKSQKKDEDGFNDVDLMLFDEIIAIDNENASIYIFAPDTVSIDEIEKIIMTGEADSPEKLVKTGEPEDLFTKDAFMNIVKKAKEYIVRGDIFQVVLSNRRSIKATGSLFGTYLKLRQTNPSPYMFYFSSKSIEIAGASPETLVKLYDKKLLTYPLAGSIRRGKDDKEDLRLEKELLSDEKEISEHNMLVDLGRNDIGKISKLQTVKVSEYMRVLKFSHIMHIGSIVEGEIRDGFDALDAIDAILPAGTLSGAPKIRATQIINELEKERRGIYGGAIGYIDFGGNLDTAISIRLAYKKNGKVYMRSGAGIVFDSNEEKEYEETINKLKAVDNAVKE